MKSVIVCFPDTEESVRFLQSAVSLQLPLILVGKTEWLERLESLHLSYKLVINYFDNIPLVKGQIEQFLDTNLPNYKILCCLSFSEKLVETTAALNSAFECWGINQNQAAFYRDKYLMRLKFKETGLPYPLFVLAGSKEERASFYRDLKETCIVKNKPFSALIKPRKLWSCSGILKFNDSTSIEKFCEENEEKLDQLLIEEYIDGDMYHVGSIIYESRVLYDITIGYHCPILNCGKTESPHMKVYTLNQKSDKSQKLKDFHRKIIETFTHPIGMTECECFIEKQTGDVLLCEIACRHSAVNVTRLYKSITTIDPFELLARILKNHHSLKEEKSGPSHLLDLDWSWNASYAGLISFSCPPGHIEATDINLFTHPEILWKEQKNKSGKFTSDLTFANCLGQVLVKSENEKDCKNLLQAIEKDFKYQIIGAK